MTNVALVISALVFIVTILLLAGIFYYTDERKKRRNFIGKINSVVTRIVLDKTRDISNPKEKDIKHSFLYFMRKLGNTIRPKTEEDISDIRKRLLQAGFRRYNAPFLFYGFKVFFAALLPALFLAGMTLIVIKAIPSVPLMATTVLIGLTGFYLPNLWLSVKIAMRKEKILEGFPDALDLMVVCVEAGMGLDAAINRVGQEMKLRNAVLSEEFGLLSLELRAGKRRSDALRSLAVRTGLDDVRSLMTLLIQTDKFGTSVAQALRVHSDSMRSKRFQRAEEIAAKLPVKLVFPLIFFILPALLVVVAGPAIIKIYRLLFPILVRQ